MSCRATRSDVRKIVTETRLHNYRQRDSGCDVEGCDANKRLLFGYIVAAGCIC